MGTKTSTGAFSILNNLFIRFFWIPHSNKLIQSYFMSLPNMPGNFTVSTAREVWLFLVREVPKNLSVYRIWSAVLTKVHGGTVRGTEPGSSPKTSRISPPCDSWLLREFLIRCCLFINQTMVNTRPVNRWRPLSQVASSPATLDPPLAVSKAALTDAEKPSLCQTNCIGD